MQTYIFLNFDKYTLLCNQNPTDVHSVAISPENFLKPLLSFTHHEGNPCSSERVGVCERECVWGGDVCVFVCLYVLCISA